MLIECAYRKPRLAHYGSRGPHVTCYTASLHLVDFKCVFSFGEAQPVATRISDCNYGGNKSVHATFGIKEAFGAERNAPCTSCYLTT